MAVSTVAGRGVLAYRPGMRMLLLALLLLLPLPGWAEIKRSASARREFLRQTGYPDGRPGFIVDHIIPLKRGGCDCPCNMQWQTVSEAKAKDRWE